MYMFIGQKNSVFNSSTVTCIFYPTRPKSHLDTPRGFIAKLGMGGAVRITAGVITVLLIIANGVFFKFKPPKEEEKPAYPLPRLDLAKYTKEMEYIFAAGGTFLAMFFIYYPGNIYILWSDVGLLADITCSVVSRPTWTRARSRYQVGVQLSENFVQYSYTSLTSLPAHRSKLHRDPRSRWIRICFR